MTRAAWAIMGVFPIIVGVHHLLCPTLYQEDSDAEPSRDPSAPPPLRPIWKVRLIGLFLVVFGVLWIYLALFAKPADEPALI